MDEESNRLTNNQKSRVAWNSITHQQRAELHQDRPDPVSRILEREAPDKGGNAHDKVEALALALRSPKNKNEL